MSMSSPTASFPTELLLTSDNDNSTIGCDTENGLSHLFLIPFVLTTIMAVPGNLLVMIAISREKRLRTPVNVLVNGLALSDILNGLIAVPCAYFWFVNYCDAFVVLYFRLIARTCCGCSVVHLVLISLDRYVSVAKPLKYASLVTRGRSTRVSLITWGVIITYMLINGILYHLEELKIVHLNHIAFVISWNYLPSSMIVVAMIITSIIYGYVIRQARQLRRRMSSITRAPSWCNPSRQVRATKTLAIVVLAFAICWLPISFTIFSDPEAPGYDPIISLAPTMLYFANSFMNPLIYAHRSKDFRAAFKRILHDVVQCSPFRDRGQGSPDRSPSTNRPSIIDGRERSNTYDVGNSKEMV